MKTTKNRFGKCRTMLAGAAVAAAAMGMGALKAEAGMVTVNASGQTNSGTPATFYAIFSDTLTDIDPNSSVGHYVDPTGTIIMVGPSGPQSWTGLEIYVENDFYSSGTKDVVAIQSLDSPTGSWVAYTPTAWLASDALTELDKINDVFDLTAGAGWNNINFASPNGFYSSQLGGLGIGTVFTHDASVTGLSSVPTPRSATLAGR